MTTATFEYALLPPIVRFDAEDDGEMGDDTDSWETELADSSRPPSLKAAIMAFVSAMAALAGTVAADATRKLGSETAAIPVGGSMVAAEEATRAATAALGEYVAAAAKVVAEHAPKIATELTKWVIDSTGVKSPISTAKVEADLAAKVQQYISGSAVDLRKAANVAVVNWRVVPGGTEQGLRDALAKILDGATWQAKRTVTSEVQNAYKDLFRDAAARTGVKKIERIAMPTACPFCAGAAGVYEANDPDLYVEHPFGQCVWDVAEDGASVDFSASPLVRLEGVLL